MNKYYFNSEKNSARVQKPSKSIRLLLMVLFFSLFGIINKANAATYYSIASGNWNSNLTWSLTSGGVAVGTGVFPKKDDIVIITTGNTVTVTADAAANSVSISGILTINDGKTLTVYGNVDVASGGQFNAGTGNNESATIKVYGNFTNNGAANFWKSTVVIAGDLFTVNTILQNNGNIIVGGNVSGVIGGSGSGIVYPVNPSASVIVTGNADEKPAGTLPPTGTLLDLANEVIYGGTCPFVANIANVSACSMTNATFSVVFSSFPSTGNPTYLWEVNTNNGSGWASTGVTSSALTLTNITTTMSNYKYRAKITWNGCTKNSNYGVLTVPSPIISTQPLSQLDCEGHSVYFSIVAGGTGSFSYIWQRKIPGELLFTNIPSSDTNVSYSLPRDKMTLTTVGSVSSFTPNGTQYQVIVSNGTCSITSNPATLSVNELIAITPNSTTVTQCYGSSYSYTVSTSNPSNGTVSYQWKSSVASGIWTEVLDGAHFSGATTATLKVMNGTPAESADYRVYVTFNRTGGTCSVDSSSRDRKLTFLPQVQAPIISQSQSICINTAPAGLTALAATGGSGNTFSYQWQTSSDNSSWTNVGTNTLSYQPPALSTSTYYRIVVSDTGANSCGTATSSVVLITVNPLPVAPTLVAIHPDCTLATGSVSLSGLPPGDWTLKRINGMSIVAITGKGPNYKDEGLVSGIYNYTVSNGNCTSTLSNQVSLAALTPATNVWNGTTWSTGIIPNSNEAVVFDAPVTTTFSTDITGCSCQVKSGVKVVFSAGSSLIITNEITVETNGSLTFEDKSSLVQINDNALNSGNIIYKRKTTPVLSSDYTYWSSPVAGLTLNIFPNAASGRFYSFNAAIPNWQYETTASSMLIGTGYIVQIPVINAPQAYETTFVGLPNNGIKKTPIGPIGGSNLIGNPYPSALDADQFLIKNKAVIGGTLAFWTHNTAIQLATNIAAGLAGSGAYAYTSDDYAYYNLTGGLASASAISDPNHLNLAKSLGNIPSGKIAAGQSFFATSSATGSFAEFNNSMRLSGSVNGNNSQFFKRNGPKSKTTTTIEKNRIWLNFTNTQGIFKQTLVGYVTGATNDYENGYDGETANSNTYVDFYSINQSKNLAIQGRALPFVETDEIQLGYSSTISGVFTISIDQFDGLLTNQKIFLKDKGTNTIFDLKSGDYNFTTAIGVFNDRFVLCYTNKTDKTLGSSAFSIPENQVLVSNTNKQIQINSVIEIIDKVLVYNLSGKLIYQKNKANANELIIGNLIINHQPLVLKIVLKNGDTLTRKIIY